MKIPFSLCLTGLTAILLVGCGGSGGDDNDDDQSPVATQVDRMGRPGITTALVSSTPAVSSMLKDAYNQAANKDDWAALFQADIQSNLEFVDGIDGLPGNALLGDSNALAGAIVDDQLRIDTSIPDCDAYLAVELSVPGDCGGRTLARDVIDDTLGALIGSPIVDNVSLDSAFLASFPFIGPPNGVQLDRMGRPTINTVLIPSTLKDPYNLAEDPATWNSLFKDAITARLDLVDGLDGVPGNAPLNDSAALAGIVVDDRLQINTSIPTCDAFLAVEVNDMNNCGGRTLLVDPIDDVLAAVVGGAITDNVDNDSVFFADFPFLNDPN